MSGSFRLTMAAIVLVAIAALGWVSYSIDRQLAELRRASEVFAQTVASHQGRNTPPGMKVVGFEPAERPRLIHVREPISAAATRTWLKLHKPVAMPFADETPLEDVLKYIRDAVRDDDGTTVAFYVDPIGLQEAEKTLQSPIAIDLDGLPLERSLNLLLRQLGLKFVVETDGLVIITSETSEDSSMTTQEAIVSQIEELGGQVQALRLEVGALRAAMGATTVPVRRQGSMGGSMGGMAFGGGGLQ